MTETTAPTPRYTRWSQPYEAALVRGHDHGSAAYIADQWEAKNIHLTGGTGLIQGTGPMTETTPGPWAWRWKSGSLHRVAEGSFTTI